jgi:chitodextrinase
MNIKKVFLAATVMIFMVFAISSVTEYSYAYWASNLSAPPDANAAGNVTIGSYIIILPWDSGTTYSLGDRVTNNGTTYEAKKNNPTKEPGVATGWKSDWVEVI